MNPGTTDLTIDLTDQEYQRACQLAAREQLTVEELLRKILETQFSPESSSDHADH